MNPYFRTAFCRCNNHHFLFKIFGNISNSSNRAVFPKLQGSIHSSFYSIKHNPEPKNQKRSKKYLKTGIFVASLFSLSFLINEAVTKLQDEDFNGFFFKDKNGFDPFFFRKFKLIEIRNVNHDTNIFRFFVPDIDKKHSKAIYKIINSGVWSIDIKDHYVQTYRSYTPIDYSIPSNHIESSNTSGFDISLKEDGNNDQNYIDILVKRYPNGSVSRFIHNIDVGEMVEIRGPRSTFPYFLRPKKNIGLIAGGTGIAPMYQLIKRILLSEDSQVSDKKISLLYASKSKEDILLANELISLQKKYPEKLTLRFHIDSNADFDSQSSQTSLRSSSNIKLPEGLDTNLGFIDRKTIQENMPLPGDDSIIVVSGPQGYFLSLL
ncbi:NADH-cytochrome b5 reductase 1 [Smittium mucronatum]|uniref:NADH-cytochrome b5 reductase 1 n=1 Tax=Smittium mucronatum TaxID=133383 RepID=A0A1R0H4Y0_9FUNG|nr:NADH-cytochrome b5 reductase 1 [Smittium mucronatum]